MLLSDSGTVDVSNFTLTLDDSAATPLPQNGSWGTSPRTAKPTDYTELSGNDTFPAPAPAATNKPGPAGSATLASAFNGINPNGTWRLYLMTDACDPPAETITGGWTLNVTTAAGASTTTSVVSSPNPSATGQSVTFTATVTSGASPVTTGTVSFAEGNTTLAANVPLNGSGQASFSKSNLAEGNHIITATYNGVPAFNTSNGSVNHRVNNPTVVTGTSYCNTGPISVNALPTATATPYPSNISVSGAPTSVAKVTATLKNVSHAFPDDMDVLLVGPAGQNLVLLSDAGNPGGPSGTGASNVTAVFEDAAASQLVQNAPWGAPGSTVASRPVDYDPGGQVDTFPAPAPAPSASTALSTFNATNPNGTWSLYVVSDGAPDTGSIAGGWCLNFTFDTTAPQTTIDSGPSGTIATGSASFGFSSSEAGSTFECKLDGPGAATGAFGSCSSPKDYSNLANGTYTFSVRATDAAGNTDQSPATRSFTVAPPGTNTDQSPATRGGSVATPQPPSTPLHDTTKPLLSSLALSPARFRAAGSGPTIAAPVRSTLSYKLSEAAVVSFRVERALPGRRVGGRCVKPRRSNRRARRCTRYVTLRGAFTHRGNPGQNRIRFSGRLNGRKLAPGRYRLRAVATDPAGNSSPPHRSSFRIVRR